MVEMAEVGTPISLDVVAVHPDFGASACVIFILLQTNPEDGKMYLLVLAHPGCPRQNPESRKMVVCVCVLSVDGDADAAMEFRIQIGWN